MIRLNHSLGYLNPILRCWFKSKFLPSNDGSRVESCKPCGRPNGVWHLTLTWPSPGYCVHLRNQKIRLAGRKLCLQLCSFYPFIHLSISPSTNISLCLSMWMKINSFFSQISITQLQMMTQENITSEQKTEVFISTPWHRALDGTVALSSLLSSMARFCVGWRL